MDTVDEFRTSTSLVDVWVTSGTDVVEEDGIKLVTAVREEKSVACEVLDELLIAQLVKAVETVAGGGVAEVDLFMPLTGGVVAFVVLRSAVPRAGQTETIATEKKEKRGGGGRMECVSERRSSTQLLLFCATETILSTV